MMIMEVQQSDLTFTSKLTLLSHCVQPHTINISRLENLHHHAARPLLECGLWLTEANMFVFR